MLSMIERPSILVTSLGRTGTEFFARLFAEIIPDCTSLHEPDVAKFVGVDNRLVQLLRQIRQAGVWRMVLLKSLGAWSLGKISDARFVGKLDASGAARILLRQRQGFIESQPGSCYVEANFGYYGLMDITPRVFANHRVVFVIRDGRDWVSSGINWGEAYGKGRARQWLSHRWPSADQLPGDAYAARWGGLSLFERYCWAWSRMNEYALNTLATNPNARLFHFEKIYSGGARYEYLDELVHFAADVPGIDASRLGKTDGWLERKIHAGSAEFPRWSQWTAEQKKQFQEICGPLMERAGYPL